MNRPHGQRLCEQLLREEEDLDEAGREWDPEHGEVGGTGEHLWG